MVEADINETTLTGQIILRPNKSWTWQANLNFLYALFGLTFSLAISFALMGAWLVLLYSIMELAVVYWSIYLCCHWCNREEVITISEHHVVIEKSQRKPQVAMQYQRCWAKFMIRAPRHPWDPAHISIRSHGRETTLGGFLNRNDADVLKGLLKRVTGTQHPYPAHAS